jgi:hypothetical protein
MTPDGTDLVFSGYKYNSRDMQCFIHTKDAGSTLLGQPYKARHGDRYGNVVSRDVQRPEVISRYFQKSNVIDAHNHARQFESSTREIVGITHDCWFRLITTIIGFTIPDAWKALRYGVGSKHPLKDIGMMDFVKEIFTNKQFRTILIQQGISHLFAPQSAVIRRV